MKQKNVPVALISYFESVINSEVGRFIHHLLGSSFCLSSSFSFFRLQARSEEK